MTLRRNRSAIVLFLFIGAACDDATPEGGAGSSATLTSALSLLADRSQRAASGLYFLPPLVPTRTTSGVFDPRLSPVVRIDQIDPLTQRTLRTVKIFERRLAASGSIHVHDRSYEVQWNTKGAVRGATYRIHVLLSGRDLGFVDVKLPTGQRTKQEALGDDDEESDWADDDDRAHVGKVVDGMLHCDRQGVLHIRFFLNRCAPVDCQAKDSCHGVGVCRGETGICTNPVKSEGSACGQVPSSGGEVLHPNGSGVTVPPGTFPSPVTVRLRPAALGMAAPEGFRVISTLSLEMPPAVPGPIKLFVPAPTASPPTPIVAYVVAKVIDLPGGSRLAVVDTASIHGARLITNSPPFPGIREGGTFVFLSVPAGAGLHLFSARDPGGAPAAGALIDLAPQAPTDLAKANTPFVGIAAGDGFAAIPISTGQAPGFAVATSMTSAGDLVAGSAPLVAPPPPFPFPEGIPTIPQLAIDMFLAEHEVEKLPDFGVRPCGPSALHVKPHEIPEAPSRPFVEGNTLQLEVAGDDLQDYHSTTSWHNVALMPLVGFQMNQTIYRWEGIGPSPSPISVTPQGMVVGVLPGFGIVRIYVSVACLRKWRLPNNQFGVVPQFGSPPPAKVEPIQVTAAEADLAVVPFAAPAAGAHVSVGQDLMVQFYVQNKGPQAAKGARADLVFSDELTFVNGSVGSSSSSWSTVCQVVGSQAAVCNLGELAPNATAIAEVHLRGAAAGEGKITATASSLRYEPTPKDNVATVSWSIDGPDAGASDAGPVDSGQPDASVDVGLDAAAGGGGNDGGSGSDGSGGTGGSGDSGATDGTGGDPALFIVTTDYNLPGNNPNPGHSTMPTFTDGSPGWGLSVTSSISARSITTTLFMSNDTCQRSNGVIGGSWLNVYVKGPPGTPFQIAYDWSQAVSADSAHSGPAISAGTASSSFATLAASAANGQSDAHVASGSGTESGMTSGTTLSFGGQTYSLAVGYHLGGSAGSNGQCFDCSDGCCECGVAKLTASVTATVLSR